MPPRTHACPNCSHDSRIEASPWWAEGKRYQVIGRHLHTGAVQTLHATDDPAAAYRVRDDLIDTSTSHELIAVVDVEPQTEHREIASCR